MHNKCKTRQEIAGEYGVNRNTLVRMLKRARMELPKGLLPPNIVERIYEVLGQPSEFKRDRQ